MLLSFGNLNAGDSRLAQVLPAAALAAKLSKVGNMPGFKILKISFACPQYLSGIGS